MSELHLADNLTRLRQERGITQEQLAGFIGVTKASVSKWETGTGYPDILLLPRLASYFDITVDELLGYEAQLSREQIQSVYHELAAKFAQQPFEEVYKESEKMVHTYYSCYPFLLQMCVLLLNHFMLADTPEQQMQVLLFIEDLCTHIIEDGKDIGICNDAIVMRAGVQMQRGKADEVIDTMEEILNPYRLSNQSDGLLIQAYQMKQQPDKADKFTQYSMFSHLLALLSGMTQYLMIHVAEPEIVKETIERADRLIETFHMKSIHANAVAGFSYQAAVVYCMNGQKEEALERLLQFVQITCWMLTDDHLKLHGDEYFDRLAEWFEAADLGAEAVRDKKIILNGAMQALHAPVFTSLHDEKQWTYIQKMFIEKGESL